MKKVLDIWPGDPELSKVMDELQELWQKTYSFGYLKIRMKKNGMSRWHKGNKEIFSKKNRTQIHWHLESFCLKV